MEFQADCRNDGCDGVNSTEIVNEINKAICVVRVKTLRKRLFVLQRGDNRRNMPASSVNNASNSC